MKFLFLILLSLIPLQAHERYYPDTDIGHVAGIILEGEIIKKTERVLHELKKDDEVILSLEITYSFKIQRVIRGDYKDGSILKMQENLYVQGDENRGSYNTGDQFRYFYNFGEFEGDTFIPFSTATQKLIKSDTYKFPVTKNSARPHLYEYSGLDEGNRASSLSTTPVSYTHLTLPTIA